MKESDYWDRMMYEALRPSSLYEPEIYIDGNQWCALFGQNLQDGVAGFGDTPEKAFEDFDKNWVGSRITIKRTSEEWLKGKEYIGIKILDPDGWDRSNYEFSFFKQRITKKEFVKRLSMSTQERDNDPK